MPEPCLYIIDTFSLMFQVFHAIPPMTGTQGQPTNAVYGFTRDLFALIERRPTHLICAMDSPGAGQRNEIYPEYKANRDEIPPDLAPQIPLLKELLAGMRVPAIEYPAWEADDVIATYARHAVEQGMDVVIVSSDKDLRQLIGPKVRLFNCRKNQFLDEAALQEDWGIRPDQVVDYQALVGDPVDNVPGVPKVGPKTAQTLLATFGTLDNVLAHPDQAPGKKLQENLATYAEQARISRELVRLRSDLPLPLSLEDALITEPDRTALYELFTRLGFRRYASLMKSDSAPESDAATEAQLRLVTDEQELNRHLERWKSVATLELDAVVSGRAIRSRVLTSLSVSADAKDAIRLTELDGRNKALLPSVLQFLSAFAGSIVVADAKPLCHALLNSGHAPAATFADIGIMDYLLDAGARGHTLTEAAERHGVVCELPGTGSPAGKVRQRTMFDDEEPAGAGSAEDTQASRARLSALNELAGRMTAALEADQMLSLYQDLERPLIRVLAEMEHRGIALDADELRRQSDLAGTRIAELTHQIYELAGREFNIDSPKQLSEVLFDHLQLPVIRKTKTGASTDQEVLEQLAGLHPLPAQIIERRQLAKLRGTYLDALPALVNPETGRIHGTFHQTVASTGRLSSSDPNLQNIPIRTNEGRQVRRAFRAGPEGWQLVSADYSQIELRILAHFSEDPALLEAFHHGVDIHTAVAADVFAVPLEDVTSEQRRAAKAVNFGVIYGQSPFGLAAALNIEQSAAAEFIDQYFARYAGVARFCEHVLEETVRTGFARTILNRRRAISGIRNTTGIQRNLPERTAINTVIQGSAADLIKLAMLRVDSALEESSLRAALLLQIHDELVFETHPDDLPALVRLITTGMQDAMQLKVPLEVDVATGNNWLEQTPWPQPESAA